MSSLYARLETLQEGTTNVFRARRLRDDARVVVKQLATPFPDPVDVARLRREYEIHLLGAGAGVPSPLSFEMHDGIVQIVMGDNDLSSLRDAIRRRRLGLRDALLVARDVARTLVRLHAANIVHKDINPANILFRPGTDAVLIDFGVASMLPKERAELRPMALFEGTLLYAAPEQTGRMNRPIDSRTDLYSLGATLFEMLAGRPPFVSNDPLELVHAHLARPAPDLRSVAPQVPATVALIVDRLLAKHAEDRYQEAGSLQSDLERCLRMLSESGEITEFELGASEYAPTFRLRDVLYGRDEQIAAVEAACSRVARGGSEVVLFAGAPGIGKSALASESRRALATHGGRFIRGKADQLNRAVPFAPFLQAFEELIEHLLALPDDALSEWRRRFGSALGGNSRVLTNEVDGLELIVGEGQPLDQVSPSEAENRFRTVVQRFVGAIANADEPLAILLDDLQWADTPTLELLRALAVDPDIHHLLLLGTYRDNEVDANSPLTATVDRLKEAGVRLESHTLEPLETDAIAQMLAHAVDREPQTVRALATRISQKTGGNPFFARRLALDLARRKVIRYDADQNQWTWELNVVDDAGVSENVVDFMAALVAGLSDGTRRALESAAFIGSRFEVGLLAEVLGRPLDEVQEDLREALDEDLVAPVGEGYWNLRPEDLEYGPAPEFVLRFAHDRVAQAVIDGLDASGAAHMHLRIGRTLKASLTGDAEKELIFQVVGHLNQALGLLELNEAAELALLNEQAADRAVASAAFSAAHRFYQTAVELIGESAWSTDYASALRVHRAAAVAALRAGAFDTMESLVAGIERHGSTVFDRVNASAIRVESFVLRNEHLSGVEAALDALDALGVSLPRTASEDDTGAFLGAVLGRLGACPPTEIQGMRSLDDDGMALARRILVGMTTAAYLVKPDIFAFIPLTLVDNTLEHGVSDESAYGFVLLAMVLTVVGLLEEAAPLGELSVKLLERSDTRRMHTPVLHVWNTHVRVFHEPVSRSARALPDVLRLGLELGDFEYGGWATHNHAIFSFYSGWPLSTVSQTFADDLKSIERCNHLGAHAVHLPFLQLVANLRGEAESADRLVGPAYDAEAAAAEYLETGYRGASFLLAVARLINAVFSGNAAEAASISAAGEQFQDGASATQHVVAFYFYDALANLLSAEGPDRELRLSRARFSREKLSPFAAACPENHQHRLELLDAELARQQGDVRGAIAHYNTAGSLAETNGFTGEEGLVYEQAAAFYFELGAPTPAHAYLKRAYYCYDRWGATAVLERLRMGHPELGRAKDAGMSSGFFRRVNATVPHVETADATASLDLEGLIRAGQALSSEMDLDRLVDRVLHVVLQSAGATTGALMMNVDGKTIVRASKSVSGRAGETNVSLDDAVDLPTSIVRFVERTNRRVVLPDASLDPRFSQDLAVAGRGRLSVLCAPITHQGKRSGVVYLENDLTADAFTTQRVEVVELLARQASISLQNAQLYQHTRQMAVSFARFVPMAAVRALGKEEVVDVRLGDAVVREVTVMFADMRGFTSLMENRDAEGSIALLNAYLGAVTPAIERHGGFVDKFIGDGVMAIFPNSAEDAVNAAIDFQRAVNELNDSGVLGETKLRFVIGMHSGPVMMGAVGSHDRLDLGVVGDTVNLAARLEGIAKALGTPMLIAESVYSRLRPSRATNYRSFGEVQVYGRSAGNNVFELRVNAGKTGTVPPPSFGRGLAELRAEEWLAAVQSFEECAEVDPEDSCYEALLAMARLAASKGAHELVKGGVRFV